MIGSIGIWVKLASVLILVGSIAGGTWHFARKYYSGEIEKWKGVAIVESENAKRNAANLKRQEELATRNSEITEELQSKNRSLSRALNKVKSEVIDVGSNPGCVSPAIERALDRLRELQSGTFSPD